MVLKFLGVETGSVLCDLWDVFLSLYYALRGVIRKMLYGAEDRRFGDQP